MWGGPRVAVAGGFSRGAPRDGGLPGAGPPPVLPNCASMYSEDALFVGEAGMLPEFTSKYIASPRALSSIRPRATAADPAGKPMTNATVPAVARQERARAQRRDLMTPATRGRNS